MFVLSGVFHVESQCSFLRSLEFPICLQRWGVCMCRRGKNGLGWLGDKQGNPGELMLKARASRGPVS